MVDPGDPVALVLHEDLWLAALGHLTACLPNEGVGLISATTRQDVVECVRFYPGRNLNESPTRFTMDPLDVLRALEDMDREGTRLGAVIHSHPRTPPEPSPTDRRELAMPGVVSLIVQMNPRVQARAWTISPGGLAGVAIRSGASVVGEGTQA